MTPLFDVTAFGFWIEERRRSIWPSNSALRDRSEMDHRHEVWEIEELRRFIESHLSKSIRESMEIAFLPRGRRPPAIDLGVFGRRFRLEPSGDSVWSLMTDDDEPRLLDQFDGDETQFQKWLLLAIVDHTR